MATYDDLKPVAEHLIDSINGLNECAAQCKSATLKSALSKIVQERKVFLNEIGSEIRLHGGEVPTSGSVGGPLHRIYIDLKSFLTSGDSKAINTEIKRGDDTLLKAYRDALSTNSVANVKTLLQKHIMAIEKNLLEIDKATLATH